MVETKEQEMLGLIAKMCAVHITDTRLETEQLTEEAFAAMAMKIYKQKPDMNKFLFNIVKKNFVFDNDDEMETMNLRSKALFHDLETLNYK